MTAEEIRYCRQCEKKLLGRSDQFYCNDSCRNNFNRQKAKEEKTLPHPKQKAIFKTLQRNYEILKRLCPHEIRSNNSSSYKWDALPKDFEQNFFTGSKKTDRGVWHLCFEKVWLNEGENIILKDFLEMVLLEKNEVK